MKRLVRTGFAGMLFLVLLTGCIPSIHPLYTDKDAVSIPALSGTWDENGTSWQFMPAPEADVPYYELTIREDEDSTKTQRFELHAVQLGKRVFLDFFPDDPEIGLFNSTYYGMHFIPAHTFAVIDEIGDSLILRLPDPDYLEKLFREGKIRLKHENPELQGIILTASTEDLQKFVLKYADDRALFSTKITLEKPVAY